MKRSTLIVGSILTFGCGTPFQLLIHNELPADAEITVRWSQTYQGKSHMQEETALVPKGRAEEVFVWYGPPDDNGIDFLWKDGAGKHRIHVPTKEFRSDTYHAYVGPTRVQLAKRDWMDKVHLNMTSYMAPVFWCCILTTLSPVFILAYKVIKRRKPGSA